MEAKTEIKVRRGRPPLPPEVKAQHAEERKPKVKAYQAYYKEKNKEILTKKRHDLVEQHLNEKRWLCPLCQRCFRSKLSLKYHLDISSIHNK